MIIQIILIILKMISLYNLLDKRFEYFIYYI